MQLFDDFVRTDFRKAKHSDPIYTFINNSAWRSVNYIREKLEDWAKHLKPTKDFIKRFKSTDNNQHRSALLELYIHEFLRLHGYQIEIHKSADDTSSKFPDFEAKSENSCFFIECTHSINPLNEDEGTLSRVNNALDIIEDISSPSYFITVHFESIGSKSIPKKHLTSYIITLIEQKIDDDSFHIKCLPYIKDDWKINFGLIKKQKSTSVTIASNMIGGLGFTNSVKPLKRSLSNKRGSKYGKLNNPYLIVINTHDVMILDEDISKALYGINNPGEGIGNSFFFNKGIPQNTRVSGVLLLQNLVHFNMDSVNISLWHNPWATHQLEGKEIDVTQIRPILSETKLILNRIGPRISISERMNLIKDYYTWPINDL